MYKGRFVLKYKSFSQKHRNSISAYRGSRRIAMSLRYGNNSANITSVCCTVI